MQFYTFLETTVVAVSLFPAFLVFFTDGDDEITVSLGSLAATFIAFSESSIVYVCLFQNTLMLLPISLADLESSLFLGIQY